MPQANQVSELHSKVTHPPPYRKSQIISKLPPTEFTAPGSAMKRKTQWKLNVSGKSKWHTSAAMWTVLIVVVFFKIKLLNREELLLSLPAVITQFSPYAVCFSDGGTTWQLHHEFIRTRDGLTAI